MKKDIHPEYKLTVFKDSSSDFTFLTKSTIKTEETTVWEDGNTYPLVRIEISSKSHPFYTGKQRIVDTENRVKSFEQKAQKAQKESIQARKEKRSRRRAKVQEIKGGQSVTLKDMLKNL